MSSVLATKFEIDIPKLTRRVLSRCELEPHAVDQVTDLLNVLGSQFSSNYATNEALELHALRQKVSDMTTVSTLKTQHQEVATILANELEKLYGNQNIQIQALMVELKDTSRDDTPLDNAAAGAEKLGAQAHTAQNTTNTNTKKKPQANDIDYSAILTIFGNNNQAIQDATEKAATALFTVNGGTLLEGDKDIKAIINSAKAISTDQSPKQTVEQITTQLNEFASKITAKSTGDFKTAFKELSPEAQQALKYMAETKLSVIYNKSLAALYAAPIKSDSVLLTSVTNQLNEADFKAANPPETEDAKILRQVEFYKQLANVINNYQRQKQSLPQDMPETAKQERLRAIGTELNARLNKLLIDHPITEDESKELKHQISIAQVEKNPGEAAKETHGFLSKIMKNLGSAQGLTLLTVLLPIITPLISWIPGIGETLAGWTNTIAEKSTTIAQTFISLRGLTTEASKA